MKMIGFLTLLLCTSALAQAPTATPAASPAVPAFDVTKFHTTSFFRLANGDFEIIQAQNRDFLVLDPLTFKAVMDPITGKPKVEIAQTYIYDARNSLAKTQVNGANYAILADKTLVTFSTTWDKPLIIGKIDFEVETYGGTFMIKKGSREIVTISSTGYAELHSTRIAPVARLVGGNFFIDINNDLWTIDSKGMITFCDASTYASLYIKYPAARLAGGNYFYQQDGSIVTIGSNGLPLAAFTPASKPATLGGNYFIGEDGVISTVRYDGISFLNGKTLGKPKLLGYSYIIYEDNSFIAVDGMGVVHLDAVRVTSTKTKFAKTSKITDALDGKSFYTPNSRR